MSLIRKHVAVLQAWACLALVWDSGAKQLQEMAVACLLPNETWRYKLAENLYFIAGARMYRISCFTVMSVMLLSCLLDHV